MAKSPPGSLRDQLMKAGLVSSKKAKQAEKGALRQELRIKKGIDVDENQQAVEQARLAKLEHDRTMNAALNLKARQKAFHAQVKQLIAANTQREQGDVGYQFEDRKKVKKIYVSAKNKTELNSGFLAIVRTDDGYDLVPPAVAMKIAERDVDAVVYLYERAATDLDEDDPYKDYPIPDDLEW
jgi:uncharacterized protein